MQALILAGGEGTRLRPLTLNIPKPIVPIANEPFLLRQIQSIKDAGITDITLALNYQPSAIENLLGDGADFGVQLRYLIEPSPLGTAGAYKYAEEAIGETTLVLNGDILTDIDLKQVIKQHQSLDSTATIVLTEVENPSAYGLVEYDVNKRVIRFLEKPTLEEIGKLNIKTINAGIYILEPHVLQFIPDGEKYSFEYQLFPQLLAQKENFYAFTSTEDYWLDIGTPERYLKANQDVVGGKVGNVVIKQNTAFRMSKSADVAENAIIADGCVIKSGAKVYNSILGKDCIVGERSVVKNSVIWANSEVKSDCIITNSVIGGKSLIKNGAIINEQYLPDNTVTN